MRDLEVWPSGSKKPSQSRAEAGGKGVRENGKSKPKLLVELESYVSQQLFLLEDKEESEDKFDPEKFQVYRNVFSFFIDKLHTYRPLLSGIKMEYELLLEDSMRRIQDVKPIQKELESLEDDLAKEIGSLVLENKEVLEKLKKKNAAKDKDIARLRKEEGNMVSETERVESNIEKIESRRVQTHQSNLALVQSLRFYEEWLSSITRPENYEMLVKDTQNEVTQALTEMETLKVAVEGKVEREGLDEALDEMRRLREAVMLKEMDAANLEQLVERTAKSCEGLEKDVLKLEAQVTTLTPRPIWPDIILPDIDFREKSKENIDILSEGVKKLQKELMDIRDELPPELQSDDDDQDADDDWVDMEYFECLGLSEDVPLYFRWDCKIKNRKVSKRDTELLIKMFWKQKDQIDASRPKRMHVGEWFTQFLKKKYGGQASIVDWAYNLVDASLRFKYDADCEMFWKVITNQLDESVYWDEYEMTNGFVALLQKLDMTENNQKVTGRMAKPILLKAMRKWFPLKTDVRFNKLKRTLNKEDAAQGPVVRYTHLFQEDKDMNQGPFAEMVRDQHLEEREEYLQDIEEALLERAKGKTPEDKKVSPSTCTEVFMTIDPKKTDRAREVYIRAGFALGKGEKLDIDPERLISVSDFVENVSRGVVKTSTKRDEIESV